MNNKRACNAHDELLAAMKTLEACWLVVSDTEIASAAHATQQVKYLREARAAIAKAESVAVC